MSNEAPMNAMPVAAGGSGGPASGAAGQSLPPIVGAGAGTEVPFTSAGRRMSIAKSGSDRTGTFAKRRLSTGSVRWATSPLSTCFLSIVFFTVPLFCHECLWRGGGYAVHLLHSLALCSATNGLSLHGPHAPLTTRCGCDWPVAVTGLWVWSVAVTLWSGL